MGEQRWTLRGGKGGLTVQSGPCFAGEIAVMPEERALAAERDAEHAGSRLCDVREVLADALLRAKQAREEVERLRGLLDEAVAALEDVVGWESRVPVADIKAWVYEALDRIRAALDGERPDESDHATRDPHERDLRTAKTVEVWTCTACGIAGAEQSCWRCGAEAMPGRWVRADGWLSEDPEAVERAAKALVWNQYTHAGIRAYALASAREDLRAAEGAHTDTGGDDEH